MEQGAMRVTWETWGRLTVGGRLAVHTTSLFPGRRATSRRVRSSLCTELPVTGILRGLSLWRWNWHLRPTTHMFQPCRVKAGGGRPALGSQDVSSGGSPLEFLVQLQYFGGICQEAESNSLFILQVWSYLLLRPSLCVDTTVDCWAPSGCVH